MHLFVALAVSTLSSDAVLHIIPRILEIHDHHHGHGSHQDHQHHVLTKLASNNTKESAIDSHHHGGDDDDDHGHQHHDVTELVSDNTKTNKDHTGEHHHVGLWTLNRERLMLLRLSAILLTIYFIYFIEFVAYYRQKQQSLKNMSSFQVTESKITQCADTLTNHAWKEGCSPGDPTTQQLLPANTSNVENPEETATEQTKFSCGLKSRAVVILLGDSVHNFIDGVAIGASFHHSIQLGIFTTIAVICHELPHELGDMAVLMESGLTIRRALLLNLLSALTAFFGLFISILIGEIKEVEIWLLGITAGMFIYVAWIDMLAHLKHDGSHIDHWVSACVIQYSGFTLGFVMIFALGWFENNLFSS